MPIRLLHRSSTLGRAAAQGLRQRPLAVSPVAEALSPIRRAMDLHPNGPMQQALGISLARGWLDEHLARLRFAVSRDQ